MTDDEAIALMIPKVTVFDRWQPLGFPKRDECSLCGEIDPSMSPGGHVQEVHNMDYGTWHAAGGEVIEAPDADEKLRAGRNTIRRIIEMQERI